MSLDPTYTDIRLVFAETDIHNPDLRRLYKDWLTAKGEAKTPRFDDISILEHPTEARFWTIADVLDEGRDFHCRFMGSDFAEFVGVDLTGRLFSESLHELHGTEFQNRVTTIMKLIMKHQQPLTAGPSRSLVETREYAIFNSLTLPFRTTGDSTDRIIHALTVERD